MMKLIPKPLREYAKFSGRMSRSRFFRWLALLFLIYMFAGWVDLQFIAPALGYLPNEDVQEQYMVTAAIILLITPWLSSSIRRLHDVGKSGWWMLFAIPALVLFYYRNEIGYFAYVFMTTGFIAPYLPQESPELIITWLPFIPMILVVLAYAPVLLLQFRKGEKVENRYGAPV